MTEYVAFLPLFVSSASLIITSLFTKKNKSPLYLSFVVFIIGSLWTLRLLGVIWISLYKYK